MANWRKRENFYYSSRFHLYNHLSSHCWNNLTNLTPDFIFGPTHQLILVGLLSNFKWMQKNHIQQNKMSKMS